MNKEKNYKDLVDEGKKNFNKKKIFTAIEKWENAKEIIDSKADLYSMLGNAYKLIDDFDNSNTNLKKSVDIEPSNSKFLSIYAISLFHQKKYRESLLYFNKALKIEPKNHKILNDIGVIYFYLNDFNKSEKMLKKAMEIEPNYHDSIINLLNVFIEKGELDSADKIVSEYSNILSNSTNFLELKEIIRNIKNNPPEKKNFSFSLEFSNEVFSIEPIQINDHIEKDDLNENIDISIVIPIKNEEKNIPILHSKIQKVMKKLKKNYEIIFIDDGSFDNSLKKLIEISEIDENVKIIEFRQNYGQTAAMSAGFKYSHGSVIITMDGDLQNDPDDIPRLLKKMAEGYDLVSGWRKDRHDKALSRVLPSKIANKIINKLIEGTNIQLHDYGCTLKAYKKGIVKNIKLYGEMHRFIPAFAAWLGVEVAEIPVKHHARKYGKAKYGIGRVPRVVFDLIVVRFFTDYMTRPIQFFGKIAKKLFTGSSIFLILLLIGKIFIPNFIFSYDLILLSFGILSIGSLQILLLGLLGEIMMRIYYETLNKDYYIVEKIIKKK